MYKEAIEALKQAIRIKPDFANAHYSLGIAYGKSGMNKEAIEAYKQARRIKPDDANVHYNLGTAYGKSGMHKEALRHTSRQEELNLMMQMFIIISVLPMANQDA